MRRDKPNDKLFLDANGRLTEIVMMGDQEVVIHYDDIPESDITLVDGLRCTTPLRTVIDLALEVDATELHEMVRYFLDRNMFTPEEAMERIAQPDMTTHLGARLVREVVRSLGEAA